LLEGILEDNEFQFGATECEHSGGIKSRQLVFQDGAGRNRDANFMMINKICNHHRGAFMPRQVAQGFKIRS
jgi:hypothetical protein